jgi:ParB/RepB/Spo0J family partition protein
VTTAQEQTTLTTSEHESSQQPAGPELRTLPLDQLQPHPDNPRLTMREEVVEAIAARLRETGRFEPVHALRVRPLTDGYQIIAGHHRREAAKRAGIAEIPCWVQVLDDATAYMELAADNNQGELTPLEVGLHALGAVEPGKGGRGQSGGISDYARALGRNDSYMRRLVAAARVYQVVKPMFAGVDFGAKTKHMAEISRAPEAYWATLVDRMTTGDWSNDNTRLAVDQVLVQAPLNGDEISTFIPDFQPRKVYDEEALLQNIQQFFSAQGQQAQTKVQCAVGVADIVTADAVYEVKNPLTRDRLFTAIGQVLLYRQAIDPLRHAAVIGVGNGELTELINYASSIGVEVILWNK